MKRQTLFISLSILLCVCSAVPGRVGVLKTRDGNTYEGEINDKDPKTVTVTKRGIPTTIDRGNILSIDYPQSEYPQRFAERKAKLAANDAAGRIALAREAFEQREYTLARDAVDEAIAINPNDADAIALRETIQSQMRLEQRRPRPEDAPAGAPGRPRDPAAGPATREGEQKLLSPVQINAIKQVEMRPDDAGVRIRLDRNVLKRFTEYSNRPPAEIMAMNIMQQAQSILRQGTPEMRKDVLILNDPPAMMQYRLRVQPFIVQNCATSACHGGNAGAKWNMVLPAESDAATYTNFYLLQKYAKRTKQSEDAVFGTGELMMIDRQRPEKSLVLQTGLPGAIAEFDHPDVRDYHPPFRSVNDPRYRLTLDWIHMLQLTPDYGFEFGTPASQPATVPATTQATRPATRPRPPVRPPGPQAQPPPQPRGPYPPTAPPPPPRTIPPAPPPRP